MYKTLTIIGTRPEVIKTSILHKLLLANEKFDPVLLTTGQHNALLSQTLSDFKITNFQKLTKEVRSTSLAEKCSEIITLLHSYVSTSNPDVIIVQGDTLSSFCGSLVGFLNKIPVAHIEAGLRTGNKWAPFPEEVFRRFNDLTADILFAPTESARLNLLEEGMSDQNVFVTGNTAIDALKFAQTIIEKENYIPSQELIDTINSIKTKKRIPCVLTIHRREAQGEYFQSILHKLSVLAEKCRLSYILPLHPAPWIKQHLECSTNKNIIVSPPLSYLEFVWLMKRTELIFTDSGGIQEEGPYLAKAVIVLRKETERPEAILGGNNYFIDRSSPEMINELLQKDIQETALFGDGYASMKILGHLQDFLENSL